MKIAFPKHIDSSNEPALLSKVDVQKRGQPIAVFAIRRLQVALPTCVAGTSAPASTTSRLVRISIVSRTPTTTKRVSLHNLASREYTFPPLSCAYWGPHRTPTTSARCDSGATILPL